MLNQLREHFEQCIGYLVFDPRNKDNTYATILSNGYSQKKYKPFVTVCRFNINFEGNIYD